MQTLAPITESTTPVPIRTAPRPRVVGAQSDTERVICAAWMVLHRSRFRSLKVSQVLAASGMSASAFYRRFPSKAALLILLLQREMESAARRFERAMAEHGRPEDQVRAWVRAMVGIAFDEHLSARAQMFTDPELAAEFPEAVEDAMLELTAPLARSIAQGHDRGDFHSTEPVTDARAIYYLCAGAVGDLNARALRTSYEGSATSIADFVLRALR